MGGRAGQTQAGTNSTQLPANQQQNVDMLMSGARDFYNSGGPQYYSGQTYAGTDPLQLQGRQQATDYANGVGQDLVNSVGAGDKTFLNTNNIFNPSNIPGFQRAQQGVTSDVTRNLTESILPQIREGSIASGSLGGSRQGLGEALAVEGTNRQLGDTLANMNMQAYNSGLQQYNAAANRAPQTYALGLDPANTLQQVGSQNQADVQQGIDADMSKFNFEQLAPYLNLQMLQGLTGTSGQYGGTQATNQTANVSDGGSQNMQIAGTVLTIAAIF